MAVLALDMSKKSTGWAFWKEGLDRPTVGTWKLGDELTPAGVVFLNLHKQMNDLFSVSPYERVIYEKPLDPATLGRQTSFEVPFLLIGLAAHADSFCEAKRLRSYAHAHQATWRRHFIGSMKRGTKKQDLKGFTMQRCRELGFAPRNDDEADALGILDYDLYLAGIQPPWRASLTLEQQFVGGKRR